MAKWRGGGVLRKRGGSTGWGDPGWGWPSWGGVPQKSRGVTEWEEPQIVGGGGVLGAHSFREGGVPKERVGEAQSEGGSRGRGGPKLGGGDGGGSHGKAGGGSRVGGWEYI